VATLLLAAHTSSGTVQLTSASLRSWLRGDWAILFSHPDDFVSHDLEMDRWLVVTRQAFAGRGIRPMALASAALDPQRCWITEVSGDPRSVLLEDPSQQHFGPVDLQTPVLRAEIEQPGRRFVMIIDGELRQQKLFSYDSLSNLPSPLEFLGWAEALRAKQLAADQAHAAPAKDTNRGFVRAMPTYPFFAARRHRHPIPQAACTATAHGRVAHARAG
jgi:hypothetical protein